MDQEINIGVDPGKGGAMAVNYKGKITTMNYDFVKCRDFINTLLSSGKKITVLMEDNVFYFSSKEGKKERPPLHLMKLSENQGIWEGWLNHSHVSFLKVRAREWQRKYSGLSGLKNKARKDKLKKIAIELFPEITVTEKNADALLLMRLAENVKQK